jgi:ankyrin repeat protein
MSQEETTRVVNTWFSALDRGDLKTALSCLAEDIEWVNVPKIPKLSAIIPWTGTSHGVAEVQASFRTRDEVARVEVFRPVKVLIQGDEAFGAIFERSVITRTNTPFEIEFATWLEVRDGKIARWKSYCDPSPIIAALRVGLPEQLLEAVQNDRADAVARLLEQGADPNVRDPATGLTVLMTAACHARPDIVRLLLEAGADVFTADSKTGATPLHKACQGGSTEVGRLLLERGAFVDAPAPTTGHTPVMDALWYKWPEMVQLLVDHDANLNLDTHYGFTMMDHLRFELNVNTIGKEQLLQIEKTIADRIQRNEATIARQKIMAATKKGDQAEVARLIAAGEDVNERQPVINSFEDGHTPLLVAARDNHPQVVRVLLDAGAEVRVADWVFKGAPIHKATYNGNPEILGMIMGNPRADLDVQGALNGYTPIHDALWHGYTECAEMLLEAGARLDLKGHDGKTPLAIAIDVYGAQHPLVDKIRARK